jgi:hypothetical protein
MVHKSVINGGRYSYNEDFGALGNNEYVLFALGPTAVVPSPMYIFPEIFNNPNIIDTSIISATNDNKVKLEFYGQSDDVDQVYFSFYNNSGTTVDFYVYYR